MTEVYRIYYKSNQHHQHWILQEDADKNRHCTWDLRTDAQQCTSCTTEWDNVEGSPNLDRPWVSFRFASWQTTLLDCFWQCAQRRQDTRNHFQHLHRDTTACHISNSCVLPQPEGRSVEKSVRWRVPKKPLRPHVVFLRQSDHLSLVFGGDETLFRQMLHLVVQSVLQLEKLRILEEPDTLPLCAQKHLNHDEQTIQSLPRIKLTLLVAHLYQKLWQDFTQRAIIHVLKATSDLRRRPI